MTILFDSSTISAPTTFGLGLVDVAPARWPSRPSRTDEAYHAGFSLGCEGEDAVASSSLSDAEKAAWVAGYAAGCKKAENDRLIDWEEYCEWRDRMDAMNADRFETVEEYV